MLNLSVRGKVRNNSDMDQGVSSEGCENWSYFFNGLDVICDQKHRLKHDFKNFGLQLEEWCCYL